MAKYLESTVSPLPEPDKSPEKMYVFKSEKELKIEDLQNKIDDVGREFIKAEKQGNDILCNQLNDTYGQLQKEYYALTGEYAKRLWEK